jgi:hypothetical protein
MKQPVKTHSALLGTLVAGVLAAPLVSRSADQATAAAADRANAATTTVREPAPMDSSDRRLSKDAESQRAELKGALKSGQTPAEMRDRLKSLGYQVTAINERDKDRVEFEVVKGRSSHEVQVNLDGTGQRARDVDVTPNLWRAPTTKAALAGKTITTPASEPDASDRLYLKSWDDEKDRLEKSLAAGQPKDFYKSKLTQLGYQVTATNDAERDYLEYEVVKGGSSYEVQLSLNAKTGRVDKVDVTANRWEAPATERALSSNARR